jgi:hypothetical protein
MKKTVDFFTDCFQSWMPSVGSTEMSPSTLPWQSCPKEKNDPFTQCGFDAGEPIQSIHAVNSINAVTSVIGILETA